VAGRNVLHPCTFFQVADGELDAGVVPVELIEADGVPIQVGEEGEVPPVRPEPLLRADEPSAAHE
jgi:hypothetical protein